METWFQEVSLYFLVDFASDSSVFDRDGAFEGGGVGDRVPVDPT